MIAAALCDMHWYGGYHDVLDCLVPSAMYVCDIALLDAGARVLAVNVQILNSGCRPIFSSV